MAFETPDLPYPYDALEPNIDKDTMTLHHDKHHATYTKKLNAAIEGTDAENKSIEEILKNASKYGNGVRNNGGGHYNHSLFWKMMSPDGGGQPKGDIADRIEQDFGSFDSFKEEFKNTATGHFGSGWAWLCVGEDGKLFVMSTPNQDNPIMDVVDSNGTPILGLDMWEHAFYLKYQNRKPEYVDAFWNVVNWDEVERLYKEAKQKAAMA
ncbi:MAG: superoxide dismutase [Flavobacteriales bacterium]